MHLPLPQTGSVFQISCAMKKINHDERRDGSDRRCGEDRRDGKDRRLVEDRNRARRLPDEFAQSAGGSDDRLSGLVNRYWPDYEEPARGILTQALIPVLDELTLPGVPVTEQHRERCEDVVVDWAAKMEPVGQD